MPEDVSVVGGDDVPMAAMTAPPLTAISVPTGEAGATAVELLRSDGPPVELAGTLVVRGSTGPGHELRSARHRRRRWWAAAFGRRSG